MNRLATSLLLGVVVLLSACGGPSQHGKEMRRQAYSRMDAVNARMVHEQAVSAFETGQLERARMLMTSAIDRFPKEPAWYVLLGRILVEQHRLDEARRSFEQAITLGEEGSEVHYYLGVLYERWSKDDMAVEHFSKASEADPGRPQFVLAWAESLIAAGQVNEAHEVISSRMDHFEHHAGLRHLQGHCEMLRGNHDAAVRHCEAALLLAPEDRGMMHDLAHMTFGAGQWGECLNRLEYIQDQWGELSPALRRLQVRALMASGRSVEARSMFKLICADSPDDAGIWREFGLLAWDIGDWNSLQSSADKLEQLDACPYERELFRALVERQDGRLQDAETRLERLSEQFPDQPEIWAVLSSVRHRAGDFSGSEKAREIAVKWASGSADGASVSGVYGTQGP